MTKASAWKTAGETASPSRVWNPAASHPRRLRLPAYTRVMVLRYPRTTFATTTAAEQGRFHWGTLGDITGPEILDGVGDGLPVRVGARSSVNDRCGRRSGWWAVSVRIEIDPMIKTKQQTSDQVVGATSERWLTELSNTELREVLALSTAPED